MAYFEVLHETKLVTDLVVERGINGMWNSVSNTAEFGGLTRRNRVITEKTRDGMESILDDIQSGKFAEEWVEDYRNGLKRMRGLQQKDADEDIEKVGRWVRQTFFGGKE